MRALSIALPNGKAVPLGGLLPKPRQTHRHFVDYVMKKEKAWMAEGRLPEPLTDEAIAAILEREYDIYLLRRTMINIRTTWGFPIVAAGATV